MTVIAWDGKTLAADRQGDVAGLKFSTTKIHKIDGWLIGGTGDYDAIQMMVSWFKNGIKADNWPKCQGDEKRYANLLVISPCGRIFRYEREPVAFEIEDKFFACGSGRDFAIAAMYLGKTAEEAVLIASMFSPSCGQGVDVLMLGDSA